MNYYELLGIDEKAEKDEIKRAYREMLMEWHPDKNPDRTEQAEEMTKTLNIAYRVLSDTQERTLPRSCPAGRVPRREGGKEIATPRPRRVILKGFLKKGWPHKNGPGLSAGGDARSGTRRPLFSYSP